MTSLFGANTGATGTGSSLFGSQQTPSFGGGSNVSFGANTSTGLCTTSTGSFGNTGNMSFGAPKSDFDKSNMTNYNQQPQSNRINGRCTIRQLTNLMPEWKGHFDVADMLLLKQEKSLDNIRITIDTLVELDEKCKKTREHIQNSLNGVSMQQEKLQQDLVTSVKHQDSQNLISIKARRLAESLNKNEKTGRGTTGAFRVPNHLHVQLSKDLLDQVRSIHNQVQVLQDEVKSLKKIDMSQATNVVQHVLKCHVTRIGHLGDVMSKVLIRAESILNGGKKELWDSVSGAGKVRRAFFDAVGLSFNQEQEPQKEQFVKIPSSHEITRQIDYLRRFNNAFKEFDVSGMDDTHYNIKELLQQPTSAPQQQMGFGTPASSGMFGTSGTSLFGSTQQQNTGAGGLFGSTQQQNTGAGGLFGSAQQQNTGAGGLFGSTQQQNTGAGGLFGSAQQQNTGAGGLFGSTQQQNTGGGGLFGSAQQQNTGGGGLFGSAQQQNTGSGGLFGSTQQQNTTSAGVLFGATPQSTGTGLGASSGFGTSNQQTNAFGSSTNTGGGLFGSSNNSNASKSTALAVYQPKQF
ncbi:bifunctional Nucleoporin FG repeat/Nucleoporin NSP1-NUP62 [Babesia duncani]|uniref:Bifunctional Nucleoporin FG repeat/Nucleoporin NSP1-NUP62 n=1 Tax=Babesia duncani TaxID=323732 RepID=A0AAD9PKN1_9APIC|nr:bifunctional Nucleoporin FG repeat/Nucleoporin NSP1-NUP62 [Babesia duncani]